MIIFEARLADVSPSALGRFTNSAQRLARVSGPVDILITGSRRMRELNRRFRKKDRPTDVLCFPHEGGGGDIAICAEIARENALKYGHDRAVELKVLILHGMLHLAGYDHERDNGEMGARETALRRRLGLPVSLIERSGHSRKPRRDTGRGAPDRKPGMKVRS